VSLFAVVIIWEASSARVVREGLGLGALTLLYENGKHQARLAVHIEADFESWNNEYSPAYIAG